MALIKRGTILKINKTASSATELLIDRPLTEETKVVEGKNPEFLYFVAKAIAAGDEGPIGKNGSREPNYNGNADYFPKKEIESAYQTFIGKGIYLDHNASSVMYSVGKIMDAYPTVDPDNGEWSISCLAKIDRKLHPEIARKVETGELNTVSMGCSCGESKCSVCGTILRTDDDPKCEHLSPGKLMHDYTAEIDLPEYGIHKGQTVKSFAINSQINFNELSLVGVPAWPRAFVTTILSNLKNTISKKASLTKEEQLDLVAQFEKLVDTLDSTTKEQVKAEFCGCPIVKENNMSDTPQKQSNDEVTDLLKKVSAYEMEKLENYIQHKTRKAEATAAADTKTNDSNWLNSILEKAKNTAAGRVFAKTIQRLAEEEKTAGTYDYCSDCKKPQSGTSKYCKECKAVREKEEKDLKSKKSYLTAVFTANKQEPMKSSWALLDGNDKVILDASLNEIWGNQFEANKDFAISEEYGRAIAARFLDPKLGGVEKLADLWDVSYKLNKEANMDKTSEHGELFKAKNFFVPGSDSSNDYKPEDIKHMSEKEHAEAPGKPVSKAAGHVDEKFDITEGKGKLFDAKDFFVPGSDSSNKWNDKRVKIEYTISKPVGEFFKPGADSSNNYKATDAKIEYNIPGKAPEAGQKGPAAPKHEDVKTTYDFKKPEGEFVNTNKKTKIDEEHAKSEEKMKTGYKGDLMYDEEKKLDEKGGKKESSLKQAGEVSHKVENGSNDNMLKNPKTSGDTPETSADGGSYVKSSKTVGDSPESSVKGDVYPNKDPKTSGDEPVSSYNKTAKTVGDAPDGAVKDSQYPKASEPNKDPEASVAENNMPKGTPDLTKTPDSSVQEKMPAPAKADKDPETSVKDTKFEKHPDLTSKPDTSSKEDQYPTPANPAKEPDSSYQKDSSLKIAKTPAGWEHAVRELKKEKDIDNPWAVVNYMKNKGYTPHKKSELDLKADAEMCAKCAMPLHECACMAAQEDIAPTIGSAFDKVEDKLTIGDGYDASKDKETKEIVISKDGKEMKRLPDGFGADVASVTSLLKAVLGLPTTEETKDETLSPVDEVVEKVEVHPEISSPSETPSLKASALETELQKKAEELKAKEEEINKKEAAILAKEAEIKAEKFQKAVASKTDRCRRVIEAMLEKSVLAMDETVLKEKLQEGTYLLDARKAALDHAISAKLKELMAMDDVALKAVETTVDGIKLPEQEVSKKANRVPFIQWENVTTQEDDIKAIFDQMGKRSHWNQ